MIPEYKYKIYSTDNVDFSSGIKSLLSTLTPNGCVRAVVFAKIENNSDYCSKLSIIKELFRERFNGSLPALSLVAQEPLATALTIECCFVEGDNFRVEYHQNGTYVVGKGYKEIVVGGVMHDPINASIKEQSEVVFSKIASILKGENCPTERIVRQWNYIEQITCQKDGEQNYQLFNDARSQFYTTGTWSEIGYPAATGIGTTSGGIVVDFNAIIEGDCDIKPIDNPLQIAAHDYTKNVLLGEKTAKTTPKFERAKSVTSAKDRLIYISGTAAIRGEKSLLSNAAEQTLLTMENIDHLISIENQELFKVANAGKVSYSYLRAYIKYPTDFEAVRDKMNELISSEIPVIYLYSDVCRDELLVEVEAIAQ